jgi:hypothetical protein
MQHPMHHLLTARLEDGKMIAHCEFTQAVDGENVTSRLTYRFLDGSIDDEMTTYRQRQTFQLVRNHHIQNGPFFTKPVDIAVEVSTGIATLRTTDKNGKVHIENEHVSLPGDLANGFTGTILLNTSLYTAPFRVGMLVPVNGARLIRLMITSDGERPFPAMGQTRNAAVFRVHPELGGIVGAMAPLLGLQPKDVMVWISQEDEPKIVRIVGQLGGYGPVIRTDLEAVDPPK